MKRNQKISLNQELRGLSKEFFEIKNIDFKKLLIMLCINDTKNKTNEVIEIQNYAQELLLQSGSSVRKQIMNILGLGRNVLENLNKYIINRNFLEAQSLFNSLRDFLISSYDTLDLIIYKYDEEENKLTYYAGNKSLDSSIIHLTKNPYYKNEIKAIESQELDPITKSSDIIQGGLYCKKISLPWGEDLILSFHPNSDTFSDFDKIDLDIRRVVKLFQKNGLLNYINVSIRLINAQYIDDLTGAFNKRYAREIFKNKKYSAIFVDITDFKNINDTFGHSFGDEVLKEITHVLNKTIRNGDRVFRNGGDEFVVLVSSFDESVVKQIEDRIHECVNSSDFSNKLCIMCENGGNCTPEANANCNKLKKYDPVSVKTGYHVFNHKEGLSLDALINKADIKMLSKESNQGKIHRIKKTGILINDEIRLDEIISFFQEQKEILIQQKEEA